MSSLQLQLDPKIDINEVILNLQEPSGAVVGSKVIAPTVQYLDKLNYMLSARHVIDTIISKYLLQSPNVR